MDNDNQPVDSLSQSVLHQIETADTLSSSLLTQICQGDPPLNTTTTPTDPATPHKLTAYPLVYHPSVDATGLEDANIGIFPPKLLPSDEIMSDSKPITFMVEGEEAVKPIYVVAHEFSAQDSTCYLPAKLLNDGWIMDGGNVSVSLVNLPEVTRLVLQPITDGFAATTVDPKLELESVIVSKYQVISKNDTIIVNQERLTVVEVEPADMVSTFNSDPSVEFLPSVETQAREKQEQLLHQQELLRKQSLPAIPEEVEEPTDDIWEAFSGVGRRLDGSVDTVQPIARKPRHISNQTTTSNIRNTDKFKSFGGEGRRLGSE